MLKTEDFMPFAPGSPGETKRINHSSGSCSGSSRSMTIRMDSRGTVHAKCWRCGEYRKVEDVKPSSHKSVLKNKRTNFDVPDDVQYSWAKMPIESIVYLNKFNFKEGDLVPYGVGWSYHEDALILPAQNLRNPEPGWQGKYFGRRQRYTTVTRTPQDMYTHLIGDRTQGFATKSYGVVITEDLLSAIRVRGRVLSSFALLGTELTHKGLNELTYMHNRFYVWLDNDNAIVDKKARDIANRLSLFGDVKLIKELREPKELSSQEIASVLWRAHTRYK